MRHNVNGSGGIVHVPVLWKEVLEYAEKGIGTGSNIFIDCTLGEGGHSELLLEKFSELTIIGFERDGEILEIARKRLERFHERMRFVNANFSDLSEHINDLKGKISGMLYDFGISSFHFDISGRGFGFSNDEYLDMRLDKRSGIDAYHIVNKYPENKLTEIFYKYGEERWAKKIAKDICAKRSMEPVKTTARLAEIVYSSIPKRYHAKNIHPATRVFQAIRIEVNDELGAICRSLGQAYEYLAPGGVMICISFHSLEDRIVKDMFRRLARGCTCNLEQKHCMCTDKPIVSVLTKKPVLPDAEEIKVNRRSRSAKLRACVKL